MLLAILFLVAYYYFTYIDENITQGSGYGFSIGKDKRTVFNGVSKDYSKKILGMAVLADGDFHGGSVADPQSGMVLRDLQ